MPELKFNLKVVHPPGYMSPFNVRTPDLSSIGKLEIDEI